MANQQPIYSPSEGSNSGEHSRGFDVRWRHYYPQLAIHPPPQYLAQTAHQFYSTPQQQGIQGQQLSQVGIIKFNFKLAVAMSGY